MKIIALVGLKCSGKDTVAEYIETKYSYVHIDYTKHLLTPILNSQGKESTRENLVWCAMELRKAGNEAPTRLLAEKVSGNSVISGIRFKEEVNFLKEKFGRDFILISVSADPEVRYKRAVERNKKGEGTLTFEQFQSKDSLPTEKVIPDTSKLADFFIENNTTTAALYKKIDKIMERVK